LRSPERGDAYVRKRRPAERVGEGPFCTEGIYTIHFARSRKVMREGPKFTLVVLGKKRLNCANFFTSSRRGKDKRIR